MTRVAVFGYGSWGTAFSMVLADAGADVVMWGRRRELVDVIASTHENPQYLPGVALPESITATHEPAAAAEGAEVVVLVVPSQTLRANLTEWAGVLPSDAVMVSMMKGIELGTTRRMSEVVAELTGAPPERIAVVSGPNLAAEVAARQPAASVVACVDEAVAEKLQQVCATAYFRPYTNTDVVWGRARWGRQERHRAGGRHRQGHGDGRQLAGLDRDPRTGRDHPARAGAGR